MNVAVSVYPAVHGDVLVRGAYGKTARAVRRRRREDGRPAVNPVLEPVHADESSVIGNVPLEGASCDRAWLAGDLHPARDDRSVSPRKSVVNRELAERVIEVLRQRPGYTLRPDG